MIKRIREMEVRVKDAKKRNNRERIRKVEGQELIKRAQEDTRKLAQSPTQLSLMRGSTNLRISHGFSDLSCYTLSSLADDTMNQGT